jgi:hypothetical protein
MYLLMSAFHSSGLAETDLPPTKRAAFQGVTSWHRRHPIA